MKPVRIEGQTIKTIALWIILILTAVLCLAGMTVVNTQFAGQNPGGSDFLVAWEGMRSVMQGESPYSDGTAERIQRRFYGRLALPGENELRVPYPIYSLLFLSPLSLTADYSIARGIWMTLAELATMGFAVASIRLSGKTWARWQVIVFILFSLLWYFGLRAIINGNVVILVAFFLAIGLLCLERKWDWAAGAAMACSTFKPQVAIFPIAGCLVWLLMARRYRPILWFLGIMLALVGIGWILSPSWISDNWSEVLHYASYDAPGNPESSLRPIFGVAGSWIGISISIAALMAILVLWIRLCKADLKDFKNIFYLTLILAPLSGMQTDAGNQYILLLPIAFILAGGMPGPFRLRFVGLTALLFFGLWGLFILTIQWADQPVQHPLMLFPLPVLLLGIWVWDRLRHGRNIRIPS